MSKLVNNVSCTRINTLHNICSLPPDILPIIVSFLDNWYLLHRLRCVNTAFRNEMNRGVIQHKLAVMITPVEFSKIYWIFAPKYKSVVERAYKTIPHVGHIHLCTNQYIDISMFKSIQSLTINQKWVKQGGLDVDQTQQIINSVFPDHLTRLDIVNTNLYECHIFNNFSLHRLSKLTNLRIALELLRLINPNDVYSSVTRLDCYNEKYNGTIYLSKLCHIFPNLVALQLSKITKVDDWIHLSQLIHLEQMSFSGCFHWTLFTSNSIISHTSLTLKGLVVEPILLCQTSGESNHTLHLPSSLEYLGICVDPTWDGVRELPYLPNLCELHMRIGFPPVLMEQRLNFNMNSVYALKSIHILIMIWIDNDVTENTLKQLILELPLLKSVTLAWNNSPISDSLAYSIANSPCAPNLINLMLRGKCDITLYFATIISLTCTRLQDLFIHNCLPSCVIDKMVQMDILPNISLRQCFPNLSTMVLIFEDINKYYRYPPTKL